MQRPETLFSDMKIEIIQNGHLWQPASKHAYFMTFMFALQKVNAIKYPANMKDYVYYEQ